MMVGICWDPLGLVYLRSWLHHLGTPTLWLPLGNRRLSKTDVDPQRIRPAYAVLLLSDREKKAFAAVDGQKEDKDWVCPMACNRQSTVITMFIYFRASPATEPSSSTVPGNRTGSR